MPQSGSEAQGSQERHPGLDVGRPQPDRHLGRQAGTAAGKPWSPFAAIPTAMPGVQICEQLAQAGCHLDKFTLIRSVDARFSSHNPQPRVPDRQPRLHQLRFRLNPAIGSVVGQAACQTPSDAPLRGRGGAVPLGSTWRLPDTWASATTLSLPNRRPDSRSIVSTASPPGRHDWGDLFQLPEGLSIERLGDRSRRFCRTWTACGWPRRPKRRLRWDRMPIKLSCGDGAGWKRHGPPLTCRASDPRAGALRKRRLVSARRCWRRRLVEAGA